MDIRSDKAGPGTSAVMVRCEPVLASLEWADSRRNAREDDGDGASMGPILNRAGAIATFSGHGCSIAAAAADPRFTPAGGRSMSWGGGYPFAGVPDALLRSVTARGLRR